MERICCMGLTLASRIIGMIGLTSSILLINVLVSDFFSNQEENFFASAIDSWILFGLNWTQLVKNSEFNRPTDSILLCFLIYSLAFLCASGLLILGSIYKKRFYAMPWLFLELISITDQFVALIVLLTQDIDSELFDSYPWYTPLSSLCLLISVYFWMTVYNAQKEWYLNSINSRWNSDPNCISTVTVINTPKTPSVLAQNFSLFESPLPPVLPKYDEL
ncbi:uncharacterized protein LOC107273873 [Cephus cinctus]|uniref:Uncharacterized protein LOC107273873 n=1 Tax=Cephus cinctus TaxID=211228 RepID=A0AAJ7CDJ9_CEPCN|nr:uncharacterized protein LOC107273873 [Cephus cinctus]XP_015607954.1 uncharacterized protein LOC107273873 [Cephus cinctus]XP_015607955.1 uncharacterized protein LOC107273873 [Cephus cinctus]